MKKTITICTTILSMAGIFLGGANASAAEPVETKSTVGVTFKKPETSFELKVKDVDFGTVPVRQDINGFSLGVSDLVTVKGNYASETDKVDITVQRTDEMGENNIPIVEIGTTLTAGVKAKVIEKEPVKLYDGVSGQKFTSGDFEKDKDCATVFAKIDPNNFKSGKLTADLKWTLTPHVNI
ncbi:MAG TPA: hypothetical protein IAA20_07850 [Candidatus Enterococcus avicola]|uniref:WxL domain-containing protein n=1 Tax=Candidatus Enterococcus avicola TaxID=2838561 RepID=A0A9D2F8M3_9ENTE|nr:hypothetical protein [Candidatus Enterococcus avicola]